MYTGDTMECDIFMYVCNALLLTWRFCCSEGITENVSYIWAHTPMHTHYTYIRVHTYMYMYLQNTIYDFLQIAHKFIMSKWMPEANDRGASKFNT